MTQVAARNSAERELEVAVTRHAEHAQEALEDQELVGGVVGLVLAAASVKAVARGLGVADVRDQEAGEVGRSVADDRAYGVFVPEHLGAVEL